MDHLDQSWINLATVVAARVADSLRESPRAFPIT